MKRLIITLVIVMLLLSACSVSSKDESAEVKDNSAVEIENTYAEISKETISCLEKLIKNQTDMYDCTVSIYQHDGALEVFVSVGDVSVKPIFGEVVAGTVRSCKAVSEEYYCPISEVSVKNGSGDRMINWHSKDLETGMLVNSETNYMANMTFSEVMEYCGLSSDWSLPQP